MREHLVLILILLLVAPLSGCSEDCPVCVRSKTEVQLAEMDLRVRGGSARVFDSMTLSVFYSGQTIELPDVALTDGNDGYSVECDETSTGVSAFIEKVTNGADEMVLARFYTPGGFSADAGMESELIGGGTTGDLTPDLEGTRVTRILIHLVDVSIDSPGRDPNDDGIWTSYDNIVKVEFRGYLNGGIVQLADGG